MMDDRSERLRKRRKQSRGPTRQDTGTGDPKSSGPSSNGDGDSDEGDDGDGDDGNGDDADGDGSRTGSVKEERIGTYMYLPDSQLKDLKRMYNVLKAEYEFEYDESFEKNRHFYPLVIRYGLDGLEGMDVSEIRGSLEEV